MLWLIYLTILALPLYLVKFKIGFVPFNVLEILIWVTFAIWLIRKKYPNILISQYPSIVLPSLLILLGTLVSTLLSQDIAVSAGILKGWFLAPMVFALIIYAEVKDEKSVKRLLDILFVSSAVVALIAIFYWIFGKLTFDGRLSAIFLSPNHLAIYLAPGFLIGFGLFKLFDNKNKKAALLGGLIFIGAALYFTYSYAAWIAVLVVISGQWLVISGKRRKVLIYAFALLILIAVLFFSQLGSEKLNNLLNSERSSWQSRLMIWRAAAEIIKDHPVFGIGPGMFQKYYLDYQSRFAVPYLEWAVPQPHNIFLAFWLQTGILGLIGFLWLLIVFFRQLKRCQVPFKKVPDTLRLILAGLMIYILLHGLVDTTYFKNDLAIIFWTIIAMSAALCCKQSPTAGL